MQSYGGMYDFLSECNRIRLYRMAEFSYTVQQNQFTKPPYSSRDPTFAHIAISTSIAAV
jgi:hypothetical protein